MSGKLADPWIFVIFNPTSENEKTQPKITDHLYGIKKKNGETITGLTLQDILEEWQRIIDDKIEEGKQDLHKQINTKIDEHEKRLEKELEKVLDKDRKKLDARFLTANHVFGIKIYYLVFLV